MANKKQTNKKTPKVMQSDSMKTSNAMKKSPMMKKPRSY